MRFPSPIAILCVSIWPLPAQTAPPPAQPGPPVTLNLTSALSRAQAYSQQFFAAATAAQLAHQARLQAKAAQYPSLNWFNQYIYTQGDGTPSGVFVSNDGVHVYNEQATVHADLFSATLRAEYRRAVAAEAVARAQQEIAARGLTATVVGAYYGLVTAQRHIANARRSLAEAQHFLEITRKQEAGGEVAHADVIKAELQVQQQQRSLMDAQVNQEKARLALGVMLFPDINQQFTVTDDLRADLPLPSMDEVRALAVANNPEIRAAKASVNEAKAGISAARGAYFPSLAIDYYYGINANVFGVVGPDDRHNLGSVVQGTVTVPVWNWGATRSKVRGAQLQEQEASTELMLAQRQLQANISGFYLEAQAAQAQLRSLRESVDLATESLRLTILRYQGAEATALEVVDADTTLSQARDAYDAGLARYRVALANLQTLTGRL
jgi:outer membrane protein